MAAYKCWDDCKVTGCPGHEVEVNRQNSVMLLHFTEDGEECLLVSEVKFKAMMRAYIDRYGE